MVWYGDWLVDRTRLCSRVSMELEGRQVCHQQKLLMLTLIVGGGAVVSLASLCLLLWLVGAVMLGVVEVMI